MQNCWKFINLFIGTFLRQLESVAFCSSKRAFWNSFHFENRRQSQNKIEFDLLFMKFLMFFTINNKPFNCYNKSSDSGLLKIIN